MQINDPEARAELTEAHQRYEAALINNNVPVLNELFWDSPFAVRYGAGENLYGSDEIKAYRKERPHIDLQRTANRVEICTLGETAGTVNLDFVRSVGGVNRFGRQSQCWIKFAEGWKIVAAHVSFLPAPPDYVDATAARIGLAISPADRAGVEEDFGRLTAVAQRLLSFPLEQGVAAAPVFEP